MTVSWPLSRQTLVDASGRPILVPSVAFFAAGTTDPLDAFKDAGLTVPHSQPIKADAFGRFPRIFLDAVLYAEEVRGPYGDLLWRDDGLGYVPPAPADNSGGGGSVDPTAIAQTGDIKWRLDPGILPGWVRMNLKTIGSTTSGATELADTSAQALYVYLWQTFGDAVAPVIGGRGGTAAADWAAGKPIGVPTMQGLIPGGLDDMGSSAANRLQVSTNLTLTAGSQTATVASAARLANGLAIIAAGVAANTVITAINGTAITMSNAAGAGSTGTVPARFSPFGDVQSPAQIGGDSVKTLSNANLPAVLPAAKVTVSYPAHGYRKSVENAAFTKNGDGSAANPNQGGTDAQTTPPAAQDFTVAQPNVGGGVPFWTVQPTRFGTFYMKL